MAIHTRDTDNFISYYQPEVTSEQYYELHKDEIEAAAKKQLLWYRLYLALTVGGGALVGAIKLLPLLQ